MLTLRDSEESFELSEEEKAAGNIELLLEGRFAYADVFVNDKFAGKLMFSYKKEITELIKIGKNKVKITMWNSNLGNAPKTLKAECI